jgi:formate--tetrahydrofolate ligase
MSDIEIARRAIKKPMKEVAGRLGIPEDALEPYGRDKAKLDGEYVKSLSDRKQGHLILVTAINPTKAGEGKTTTTIGLGDALGRLGKKTAIALREPSLGPCFGQKGGATGGGQAQIVPMADINLHLTGDFHAVTAAHNLCAAFLDAHLFHGNELGSMPDQITWRRVLDMNDRALREIEVAHGGDKNGLPRRPASTSRRRARSWRSSASARTSTTCASAWRDGGRLHGDGKPVTAEDLKAAGAMTAILKDALKPTLMQTLEGTPALVHTGPFANIAHGNSSIVADYIAMRSLDFVVTEAGFGADMGAEKFFDIKCRASGLKPDAALLVATVRALKMHADPELRGAPTGHTLPIREVRLSAGAGFVVAMAGEIMSMPGLPRVPAAENIRLTADGQVDGIF